MLSAPDVLPLLRDALHRPHAGLGHLHVLQSAPGEGKSQATCEAVVELVTTGLVRHVLWAVRETNKSTSLGREAEKMFKDYGVEVSLVLGYQAVLRQYKPKTAGWQDRAVKDYQNQSEWPTHPVVKIISHSHLPLIFGKEARHNTRARLTRLREADLLIIDEDPYDTFLFDESVVRAGANRQHHAHIRMNHKWFEHKGDEVSVALQTLLKRAQRGDFDGVPAIQKRQSASWHLTGERFFREFESLLPVGSTSAHIWDEFGATLEAAESPVPKWVAHELHQDLKVYQSGAISPLRFGVTWFETNGERHDLNTLFRFDLSQFRPFPIPTVILDAYAHPPFYERAYSPMTVEVRQLGEKVPLQVEFIDWPIQRHKVRNQQQPEHLAAHFDRLVRFQQANGSTLVLTWKDTKEQTQSALEQALLAQGLPRDTGLQLHHWGAGRGSNNWKGWNVVALMPFARPKVYADLTLSALVSESGEAGNDLRQDMRRARDAAELLQMLHRGRQTLAVRQGWPYVPKVLTFFEPDFGPYSDEVVVTRSTLIPSQAHRTEHPRLEQAIQEHAQEILELLSGVPMLALQILGLVKPASEPLKSHSETRLRELITESSEPLPRLRYWAEHGQLRGYPGIKPWSANGRQQLDQWILNGLTATAKYQVTPRLAPSGIKRVIQSAFAQHETLARQAVENLFAPLSP